MPTWRRSQSVDDAAYKRLQQVQTRLLNRCTTVNTVLLYGQVRFHLHRSTITLQYIVSKDLATDEQRIPHSVATIDIPLKCSTPSEKDSLIYFIQERMLGIYESYERRPDKEVSNRTLAKLMGIDYRTVHYHVTKVKEKVAEHLSRLERDVTNDEIGDVSQDDIIRQLSESYALEE